LCVSRNDGRKFKNYSNGSPRGLALSVIDSIISQDIGIDIISGRFWAGDLNQTDSYKSWQFRWTVFDSNVVVPSLLATMKDHNLWYEKPILGAAARLASI
jgi:hypothetical protein